MPRSFGTNATAALLATETDEVFLHLFTFDPDGEYGGPYRIVNNTEDITSRGNTFTALAFDWKLPTDSDKAIDKVKVSVDNVTRTFTTLVRDYSYIGEAKFEIVLASDPDTVEFGPLNFKVLSAQLDLYTAEFTLGFEEILKRRYPKDTMNPNLVPGLFQ
jgi:hypothetical protein